MSIVKISERKDKVYNTRYTNIITSNMLKKDMYESKMSQRAIASKYGVCRRIIVNLQSLYNLELLQMFERRTPKEVTEEQKQVLYGCAIADGHIFKSNSRKHGAVKIVHTMKRESYLDYKYKLLKDFVGTPPKVASRTLKVNNKTYYCKSFRTLTHSFFTYLHDKLYRFNEITGKSVKHLSQEILDQIGPLGLAVIYMDDGTKHGNSRRFCLESFPYEEQIMFCNWLKSKFNLNCEVYSCKGGTGYRSRVLPSSSSDFDDIVLPHIHSCMLYKIDINKIDQPQRLYVEQCLQDEEDAEDIV
jgi:transposase